MIKSTTTIYFGVTSFGYYSKETFSSTHKTQQDAYTFITNLINSEYPNASIKSIRPQGTASDHNANTIATYTIV